MKKIGIITAIKQEYNSVKAVMDDIQIKKIYNLKLACRKNRQ